VAATEPNCTEVAWPFVRCLEHRRRTCEHVKAVFRRKKAAGLCTKCKEPKKRRDFGPGKQWSDGLHRWCRLCLNNAQKARIAALSPEERKAVALAMRERRNANAEARQRYLTNQQIYSLKRRYGIAIRDVLALLEKQGGVCAICGKMPEPGKRKGLVVDHDHETELVRGLLCDACNTGLGFFKDNIELLLAAIRYLIDHQPIENAAQ